MSVVLKPLLNKDDTISSKEYRYINGCNDTTFPYIKLLCFDKKEFDINLISSNLENRLYIRLFYLFLKNIYYFDVLNVSNPNNFTNIRAFLIWVKIPFINKYTVGLLFHSDFSKYYERFCRVYLLKNYVYEVNDDMNFVIDKLLTKFKEGIKLDELIDIYDKPYRQDTNDGFIHIKNIENIQLTDEIKHRKINTDYHLYQIFDYDYSLIKLFPSFFNTFRTLSDKRDIGLPMKTNISDLDMPYLDIYVFEKDNYYYIPFYTHYDMKSINILIKFKMEDIQNNKIKGYIYPLPKNLNIFECLNNLDEEKAQLRLINIHSGHIDKDFDFF